MSPPKPMTNQSRSLPGDLTNKAQILVMAPGSKPDANPMDWTELLFSPVYQDMTKTILLKTCKQVWTKQTYVSLTAAQRQGTSPVHSLPDHVNENTTWGWRLRHLTGSDVPGAVVQVFCVERSIKNLTEHPRTPSQICPALLSLSTR